MDMKEKSKEIIHGILQFSYKLLPWMCQHLIELDLKTIAEYRHNQDGHFVQLFAAIAMSIHWVQHGVSSHYSN